VQSSYSIIITWDDANNGVMPIMGLFQSDDSYGPLLRVCCVRIIIMLRCDCKIQEHCLCSVVQFLV